MKDLNQCNFIGRIGKDPEFKAMPNGDAVVNFSIACNDDYKNKTTGEKAEKTNWVNVVAFRRLGEIVSQYCNKGSKVFVSGKLQTRKWQGQDGTDRYTTEIVASQMQMLDSKPSGDTKHAYQNQADDEHKKVQQTQQNNVSGDGFSDEIPF